MKKTVFISLFAALCGGTPHAQQRSGDSLASDFRILVRHVEETHPDPYSAFGGKVFFHREAFDAEQRLRRGATRDEFAAEALSFMSNLGDGHTRVSAPPPPSRSNLRLPLALATASYGLVATALPEAHRELLGSRVVAVGGVSVEELVRRVGRATPVENLYGAYRALSSAIPAHRPASRLIQPLGGSVAVELETADGRPIEITLDYLGPEDYSAVQRAERPVWSAIDESRYMSYAFLDTGPVADLGGEAVYTPERVFVVTNEGTFSAAFHYAFFLWRMGATVVGVPSSQAPNTFMETTEFTLPYTGLRGSVSNSAQMFLPAGDPRAKVFLPEITLSPGDLRGYGFDKHADILYLMDRLELKTYFN